MPSSHELTRFIKDWSPAKFQKLAKFLNQEYGKRGVSVHELTLLKREEIRSGYEGKTEAELFDIAYEEVVADSMEKMLADGRVL